MNFLLNFIQILLVNECHRIERRTIVDDAKLNLLLHCYQLIVLGRLFDLLLTLPVFVCVSVDVM